jgi:hypothetical protein
MSNAALKAPWLVPHQFQPGQVANPHGRPKGSRNRLEEAFLRDLAADWDEHGVGAIAAAREDDPVSYVKVIASLMPKKVDPDAELGGLSRDELRAAIDALRSFIAPRDTDSAGSTPSESREA